MKNISITQTANIAQLTLAIGIIVRIFTDTGSVTAEEWQIVGLVFVGMVSSLWSYINRKRKGDTVGIIKTR